MTIESVHSLPQPDGSIAYVVNGIFTVVKDDVPPSWPTAWADVQAWLADGNVAQPYVPPAAMPPTAVQQAQATIAAIQAKMINGQIVAASAVPPTGLTLSDVAAYKAAQAVLAGGSAT